MVQSDVLGRALQKVRSLLQGDEAHFEPVEIQELYGYTLPRLQNPELPEKDRESLEQVYAVLRDHWDESVLGPAPGLFRQRLQHGFRASLDKLMEARYDEVNNDDLAVLRAACHRMAALPKRMESHQRLMRMMADGLARYRDHQESLRATGRDVQGGHVPEVIPEDPVAAHATREEPETCREGASLFQEAPRAEIESIGPFPVLLRIRLCEVHGRHRVTGEIPEGCMLRVHEGGVHVEGACHGHIHAEGEIIIDGGVSEGWIFSEQGSIVCGRVMSAARLVALRGSITAEHGEGLALALARDSVRLSGALQGGAVATRALTVQGAIAGVQVYCTGVVRAAHMGARGQTPSRVNLLRHIGLAGFGAVFEHDDVNTLLRDLHKATLEANGCHAYARLIREDLLHRMRAILFQTRAAGRGSYTLEQVREFQKKAAFLGGVTALAQAFYCATLEALELPSEEMRRCLGGLADITTRHLGRIEQELTQSMTMQNLEARNAVGQASRHITNAIKKCREGLQKEGSAVGPLETLGGRIEEFQQEVAVNQTQLDAVTLEFGREMAAFLEDKEDALQAEVETALREAGQRNAVDRDTQALAGSLDKQRDRARAADGERRKAESVLDEVRKALADCGAVIFPETRAQCARVEAEQFDPGTLLAVTPLCDAGSGMPLCGYVQTGSADSAPATAYERQGHACRALPQASM
jgi:hypothetical protein